MQKKTIKTGASVFMASLILSMGASTGASANTEIFQSMTSDMCSPQARQAIADAARQNVENTVSRAEQSIQPPAPVGDLSCLNDLMNIDINFLSGELFSIGDILGDLMGGLSDFSFDSIEGEITRQICDFAAEQWENVTEPLNMSLDDLGGNNIAGFTDNFALINFGHNSVPNGQGGAGITPTGPGVTNPSIQQEIQSIFDMMGAN